MRDIFLKDDLIDIYFWVEYKNKDTKEIYVDIGTEKDMRYFFDFIIDKHKDKLEWVNLIKINRYDSDNRTLTLIDQWKNKGDTK